MPFGNGRLSSSMFLTMNILSGSSSVDKQAPILESEGEREGGREGGRECGCEGEE